MSHASSGVCLSVAFVVALMASTRFAPGSDLNTAGALHSSEPATCLPK